MPLLPGSPTSSTFSRFGAVSRGDPRSPVLLSESVRPDAASFRRSVVVDDFILLFPRTGPADASAKASLFGFIAALLGCCCRAIDASMPIAFAWASISWSSPSMAYIYPTRFGSNRFQNQIIELRGSIRMRSKASEGIIIIAKCASYAPIATFASLLSVGVMQLRASRRVGTDS